MYIYIYVHIYIYIYINRYSPDNRYGDDSSISLVGR